MTTITDPSFDSWLAGFLLVHPDLTVADAANFWLDQESMAQEHTS